MDRTRGPGATTIEEEGVEALGPYSFRQSQSGQRLTDDSLALSDFTLPLAEGDRVVDLGTACGGIPLLIAWKSPARSIVGVEAVGALAEAARRNVVENDLAGRVEIIEADWRRLKERLAPGSFTCVVANPPYRKASSSRVSPDPARAAARSEVLGTLDDLLDAAAYLLAPGGRACFVFAAERFSELTEGLLKRGLEQARVEFIRSKPDMPPRVFLIEARRGLGEGL